ncbi:hypothetical protein GCM10018965_058800 [Nonomuraea roseola]
MDGHFKTVRQMLLASWAIGVATNQFRMPRPEATKYHSVFVSLETVAKSDKRGKWSDADLHNNGIGRTLGLRFVDSGGADKPWGPYDMGRYVARYQGTTKELTWVCTDGKKVRHC